MVNMSDGFLLPCASRCPGRLGNVQMFNLWCTFSIARDNILEEGHSQILELLLRACALLGAQSTQFNTLWAHKSFNIIISADHVLAGALTVIPTLEIHINTCLPSKGPCLPRACLVLARCLTFASRHIGAKNREPKSYQCRSR